MEVKTFKSRLGLGSVIAISLSSMLGSGIFVLPGFAIEITGPSVWLAYLVAAFCVLPATLSKSELATAMPSSGGTYIYLERTFGPLVGTIAGLGLCLSLLLKSAFALVGTGAYLSVFSAQLPLRETALALLFFILILNILGVSKVSVFLIFITFTCLFSLIGLSGFSFVKWGFKASSQPFLTESYSGFIAATALLFVSFVGVTKAAAIAEEIRNPEKNLPLGILLSLLIVTFTYCTVSWALVTYLPLSDLQGNIRPIHTLSEVLGGKILGFIVSILGVFMMTAMASAGILAASRFPFAMGRDQLLPKVFGTLNKVSLTPVWSILAIGILAMIVILKFDVKEMAKLASAFILIIYILENVTVVFLRELRVKWYQPRFKAPFYPWIQIFGVLSGIGLLLGMKLSLFAAFLIMGIPGALLFFLFGRHYTERKGVISLRGLRKNLIESKDFPKESFSSSQYFFSSPTVFTIHENKSAVESQKMNAMVALFGEERSPEMVIEMGSAFCHNSPLEVVHLTEIPEQSNPSDFSEESAGVSALRRRVEAMSDKQSIPICFESVVCHDIYTTVYNMSRELNCQWFIREWGGKSIHAFTRYNSIGWLEDHLSSHLVTFKDAGVRYIRHIMALLSSNSNNGLVLDAANRLAQTHNAKIDVVKFVDAQLSDEVVQKEELLLKALSSLYEIQTGIKILRGKSELEVVIKESVGYDLIVLGEEHTSHRFFRIFGTSRDFLIEKAACSVMSVKSGKVSQRNKE